MAHIVIDGYNYVMRTAGSQIQSGASMDLVRRSALDKISRYKRHTGAKVTVVFDAYNSYSPDRHRENHLGIEVVYSREKETADDVIIGWIRRGDPNMVVVTSDRAIIDEAKRSGVAFVTPDRMEEMISYAGSGRNETLGEDEEPLRSKKGNPRKLPKKLRRVSKTINRIK